MKQNCQFHSKPTYFLALRIVCITNRRRGYLLEKLGIAEVERKEEEKKGRRVRTYLDAVFLRHLLPPRVGVGIARHAGQKFLLALAQESSGRTVSFSRLQSGHLRGILQRRNISWRRLRRAMWWGKTTGNIPRGKTAHPA